MAEEVEFGASGLGAKARRSGWLSGFAAHLDPQTRPEELGFHQPEGWGAKAPDFSGRGCLFLGSGSRTLVFQDPQRKEPG